MNGLPTSVGFVFEVGRFDGLNECMNVCMNEQMNACCLHVVGFSSTFAVFEEQPATLRAPSNVWFSCEA